MSTTKSKTTAVLAANPSTGQPVSVISPITCTIGLDSFAITNTRARHEDTDFVTVSLAIANRPTVSLTRALGNRNNGHFPLNMYFPHVSIAPHEIAVLTYTMVNYGHQAPGTVEHALEKGTETLAKKGAQIAASAAGTAIGSALGEAIGTGVVPIIGTALGALAGYLVGGAFGLLFANCDGPVAAAVHVLTFDQIKAALANGRGLTQTDDHPGIDPVAGCGSNSHYTVTWSVK